VKVAQQPMKENPEQTFVLPVGAAAIAGRGHAKVDLDVPDLGLERGGGDERHCTGKEGDRVHTRIGPIVLFLHYNGA
jgi:hypothetical protein